MLLPSWMSNHSAVLSARCGVPLTKMKFVKVESMRMSLPVPPKFDWLAHGIPTPALREFFVKRLSPFFLPLDHKAKSGANGGDGRLAGGWSMDRECIGKIKRKRPKGIGRQTSRICRYAPEGLIVKPSVLVNVHGEKQRADRDFERFIQAEFKDIQGGKLRVLNAEMLFGWQDKLCFRSAIVSPGADLKAGQTVTGAHIASNNEQGTERKSKSAIADALYSAAEVSQNLREASSGTDKAQALLGEGGVEIVAHPAITSSGESSPSICRIYRACRRADGTVVVPAWLQEYEDDVFSRCGLAAPDVAYVDNESFDLAYEADRDSTLGDDSSQDASGRSTSLDLFGSRTVRPQPQHFMADILPHLHSLDALPRAQNETTFDRSCIYKPGSVVGPKLALDRLCFPGKGTSHSLRPAIVVPDILSSTGPAFRFTRQFQSLLPPSKVGPQYLYAGKLYEDADEAMCFRSITVTHQKLPVRDVIKDSNALISNNGLSYNDIRESFINHRDGSSEHCRVQVRILQPRMARGDYDADDGRTFIWPPVIGNANELAKQITVEAEGSLVSKQVLGFGVSVEYLQYDGTSVPQMLHHLQKTDILIAPHEPSLTSLVFLRPGATIIEIPPFAYYASSYKTLAENLNLDYIRMPSMPDILSFKTCLKARGELDWAPGTPKNTKSASVKKVIELFESSAREYEDSGFSESLRLDRTKGETRAKVPQEKICARGQRIIVELDRVARVVVERAGRRCRPNAGKYKTANTEKTDNKIVIDEM